jgi:hypothetical protein
VFIDFDQYNILLVSKDLQVSYLYVSGKESKNEN